MIAQQRNEVASFTKPDQTLNHFATVWSAIDVIAERNQRVIVSGLKPIEKSCQGLIMSVYVSDRDQSTLARRVVLAQWFVAPEERNGEFCKRCDSGAMSKSFTPTDVLIFYRSGVPAVGHGDSENHKKTLRFRRMLNNQDFLVIDCDPRVSSPAAKLGQ
jgi:hypothetical protein